MESALYESVGVSAATMVGAISLVFVCWSLSRFPINFSIVDFFPPN
jgi:hypothetical protein